MNNYTYEQRQMIADYIENVFLKYCVVDEISLDDEEILEFKFHLAHEKITELKATTFGDIKNQIATKFKAPALAKDSTFMICGVLGESNKRVILNNCTGVLIPLENISNDEVVEVLNEN